MNDDRKKKEKNKRMIQTKKCVGLGISKENGRLLGLWECKKKKKRWNKRT